MRTISLILTFITLNALAQKQTFMTNRLEKTEKTHEQIATAVTNTPSNRSYIKAHKYTIKYETSKYIYFNAPVHEIITATKKNELTGVCLEFNMPQALADTVRVIHSVNQVHNGLNGLSQKYTGKDVIVGIVDQGLDWSHPDFKDAQGKTRVLRYWDHSMNYSGSGAIPQPFGYGVEWTKSDIDSGICTSTENSSAHGTTVSGCAVGNGRATGKEKGMAPDANIVFVETNFGMANWTYSIADACDYIFRVADSLGMPAVINLSVGDYMGSHDGNDPASDYMEHLLDQKPGRIIVCAAGNSGANGKYHVTGVVDSDTSFVWIKNNSANNAALGPNHIYVDIWSDTLQSHFNYAYAADLPAPSYGMRGKTLFHDTYEDFTNPVRDTIRNANGEQIATIETYAELVDGNYHMQIYFSQIDSTNYNFRFMTTGNGRYDAWSGAWLGLNDFITTLPSAAIVPEIIHYNMPDSLQTIVSSWNCSEKVVSVGNLRNRLSYTTKNGSVYTGTSWTPGKLAASSSKGPNRHNFVKPDISASGDVTLAAGPMWYLSNPANYGNVASDGWHMRNGGTSMASPVVAGIAALYLEKCNKATYTSFKQDLANTAFQDIYTGTTPNNAYGYGKINALNLLLVNEFSASISGTDTLCSDPITLFALSNSTTSSAIWSDGFVGLTHVVDTAGNYTVEVFNTKGCSSVSDTFKLVQYESYPIMPIYRSGDMLFTLSFTNYQWTLNGVDIPGATSNTLQIFPPYGSYTCYCLSPDGCKSETATFEITQNVNELMMNKLSISPNPTTNQFTLQTQSAVDFIELVGIDGRTYILSGNTPNKYEISHLAAGEYIIHVSSKEGNFYSKITKM